MDDLDAIAQPHCPECAVVMHTEQHAFVCPSCGHLQQTQDVEMPPEFNGPEFGDRSSRS